MHCWKCGAALSDPSSKKIPFRATCEVCAAWLHCCRNCVHYKPGMPNACLIPGTEYVADREAGNYCEDFQCLGQGPSQGADAKAISQKLFKDSSPDVSGQESDPKQKFKNLFGD